LIPEGTRATARVVVREAATVCGLAWAEQSFRSLDPQVILHWHAADGDRVAAGALLLEADGDARALLSAERTALNFIQLLSATATVSRRYADAVAGTNCSILDTRKTLPGLRLAQKYAVACGGASNHRIGLFDAILIKENHILAAGGIAAAVARARETSPELTVEVEVESLDELDEALAANADICMLDNFDLQQLADAVERRQASGCAAQLEASGNMSLDQISAVAATGVDLISVGALTKHVEAVDLSMRFRFSP
jgi:nicotinate-nucleotide pyrophosphorylase (carboxylating)